MRPRRHVPLLFVAALSLAGLGAAGAAVAAEPRTVCAITINSSDEKEAFERHLPREQFRVVELVQRGRRDWFDAACRSGVRCDALIISGHFDDGSEFYADQSDFRDFLTVPQLQQAACSASCSGLFAPLREVYLFGCKTLGTEPRQVAAAEVRRSLQRAGRSPEEAERIASQLSERYGQSNRDRIRHIFKDVPVIYGFSGQAPLGRYAGPLVERYFRSSTGSIEVASGRPSPALLALFAPVSMVSAPGLTDADPHASFRAELCRLADDRAGQAGKLAFAHELLQRDPAEVRMLLDHLEHLAAQLGVTQRLQPDIEAALLAITRDAPARARYLDFARDTDEASVHTRMMALARQLGWLSPEQERDEFARMVEQRLREGRIGKHEVDHLCTARPESDLPASRQMARQLVASGAARAGVVAHSAVLACLGDAAAHQRTVQALTSPQDADAEVAQVYLRHRPLADAAEQRSLAEAIARLSAPGPQQRALQALARQRLTDPASLQAIARIFPQARSLEVQRTIAGILLRSDTQHLARADLARSLRRHRLKSPDGSDVIDALIRVLQAG